MPKDASPTSAPTPMSCDTFKPKFPLDPFADAGVPTSRQPWSVDTDNLPSLTLLQAERKVIMVIGQPSTSSLEPLLHSLHLASSLLIIASHRPCALPDTYQPAIRVLRLRTPIAVEEAGASRLVDVLEWAEQTARLWRKNNGPRYQELVEELESFESMKNQRVAGRLRYSVVEVPVTGSSPVTPLSSQNSLQIGTLTSSKLSRSSGNISALKRQSGFSMPAADPEQRPFDAIIHFMPNKIPDKMLLKTAILVTTLTRPYLVTTGVRAPATRFWSENAKMPGGPGSADSRSLSGNSTSGGKRWSLFRGSRSAMDSTTSVADSSKFEKCNRSGSSVYRTVSTFSSVSTTKSLATYMLRARKSRIIHILPSSASRTMSNAQAFSQQALAQAEARLIRSIEAFLLSFSFPIPTPTLSASDPDFQRARPYLIPSGALADVLSLTPSPSSPVEGREAETTMFQGEWNLAELVLSGALDLPYGPEVQALVNGEKEKQGMSETAKGKMKESGFSAVYEWMAHRAWIAGVHEVVVTAASSVTPPKQAHVRERSALPAPAPTPSATKSPSPIKTQSLQPPSTQRHSPVKSHSSPVKGQPTIVTTSPTSPSKSPTSSVTSPSRSRPNAVVAVAMSNDKRLPTPPEEVTPVAASRSTSAAASPSSPASKANTTAPASAYLSPGYVSSKARGNASSGSRSAGGAPSSSAPATTATSASRGAHSQAHAYGQKHVVPASSPLAASSSRQTSTDGQPRRRETTREREHRERGREATYGLPTPPDSDEASGEGIPAPAPSQKASRKDSSNASSVAVVGTSHQHRARPAQRQEQTPAPRSRTRTESGPRLASAPSQASQTSQASTVPPTPPAKTVPLKRESANARPTISEPVRQEAQKMLRRQSKHLPMLGHNRKASASSPALVSPPSSDGSSHVLTKKRSKWKFWKKEIEA